MVGVEKLGEEQNGMLDISAISQEKPDKNMTEKEWKKYLEKIDSVLEIYRQLAVEHGKENLKKADKEREENRAVWLEDISKLMQMGQQFVAEQLNNKNIQKRQKEQEILKSTRNEYFDLAKGGIINYNGVSFVCNEDNNSICLGDMTEPSKVIKIPLASGGTLCVNRDNIGELGKALSMFSPEDIGNILRAIAQDRKVQETLVKIEEDKDRRILSFY